MKWPWTLNLHLVLQVLLEKTWQMKMRQESFTERKSSTTIKPIYDEKKVSFYFHANQQTVNKFFKKNFT
jgi:hypothetical protein